MEGFKDSFTQINSFTISLAFLIIVGIIGLISGTSTTVYLHYMLELVIITFSLNLFTGMSGYANFGHVVFYGIGAYTVSFTYIQLDAIGLTAPTFLVVILAGLFASLFAFAIGLPVLRLRGDYFAIATLGVSEAVRVTVANTKALGEGRGLYVLGLVPDYNIKSLFIFLLVIAFVVILTSHVIFKTRLGYGLRAIRADEDVAEVMGVNTAKYKRMAYAIGAFFAGLAGGVMTLVFASSFPEFFLLNRSIDMFSAMVLGGVGTMLGPLIGSVIYFVVKDALLIHFPYLHLVIFGFTLMLLILFLPRGIMGLIKTHLSKLGKVLE